MVVVGALALVMGLITMAMFGVLVLDSKTSAEIAGNIVFAASGAVISMIGSAFLIVDFAIERSRK